jgi:phosphoribosylanthranilate isomerase
LLVVNEKEDDYLTKIKLCGMMREEDIKAANKAKPDYIGFIFADFDRHYLTREKAADLKKLLDPSILAVGAFVDAPVEMVIERLNSGLIDVAQLHGKEDHAYVQKVKEETGKTVLKSMGVTGPESIAEIVQSNADFILLDTPGGCTGKQFDWSLLTNINRPFFLAGGLNEENVQEAVKKFHPYAVDISSGAETNKQKDPEKMKRLVQLVRGTDTYKEEK